VALRARLPIRSTGQRLVHGEADGLPGLVVDRYADLLSVQFGSAGSERWKSVITDNLLAATGVTRLYERSDAQVRELEGLPPQTGWLRGEGSTQVQIAEHQWQLTLDVAHGHKTGFYLDQRDNRAAFARWVQQLALKDVLNCYCYTGGFTVAALAGGAAHVTSVDSSGPALEKVQAHVQLNGFDTAASTCHDADVNGFLRASLETGRRFDAIVLDPPKFAPTAAHAERAARAYKDINRLAFKLLAPGGLLFTFSCSGGISADLFHKIVAGAAADAPADGAILQRLEGACDHPTTMEFPEGEYLKGLAVLKQA
ncbi:MAG: class I SAM-dependent rRNA methyltransferase, partial [Rubrivivax sp.]|nr:class I SAM-dependent rRNA methyltransferase [Rubrivivax sp.]